MIELHSIASASNDLITAGLVNAILTDNHAEARQHQDMIYARNDIRQIPQLNGAVEDIASQRGGKLHGMVKGQTL